MYEGIDLAPDEPVFEARHVDALIQKWLDWCLHDLGEPDSTGVLRSPTVTVYASKINYFSRWWLSVAVKHDWQLRERDFLTFNRWLTYESGLAFNSRKDVLRRLAQMFKWSFKRGYTKRDYSIWIPEPDGSAPLRSVAPMSAVYKLMRTAGDPSISTNPRRDQAVLAIVIGTGMRRSECAGLNIEDIELSADGSGIIKVHRAKRVKNREVQGRVVVFDKITGRYIRSYLDAIVRTSGPLFPGRWQNISIRPESLGRIIGKLIISADVKLAVEGLHDLRRKFITTYRQQRRGEAYDNLLRLQVGHSSVEMTNHYDLSDTADLQEAFVSPFSIMAEAGYEL